MVGVIAIVFIIAVLAIAALAALGFVRAKGVIDHAQAAGDATTRVVAAIKNNPEGAKDELATAQREVSAAREELGQVPLPQLRRLPDLGRNVEVAGEVLDEVSTVVYDAVPTFVAAAGVFDFSTGHLRRLGADPAKWIDELKTAGQTIKDLPEAIDVLGRARDAVAAIETHGLLPQVASAVKKVGRSLDAAVETVAPAKSASDDVQRALDQGAGALGALKQAAGF